MFKKNVDPTVETITVEKTEKVGFIRRNRRIIKATAATAVFVPVALYVGNLLAQDDSKNTETTES